MSIGYGASSLLAFVFYFLFAKILSVEQYGELIFLFSIVTVSVIFSRFGLGQTNTIQLAKGNEKFSSQANVLHLILVASISIILFFVNPILSILPIFFEKVTDEDTLFEALSKRPGFESQLTLKALEGSGITCQHPNEFLGAYFRYLIERGFLEAPSDMY